MKYNEILGAKGYENIVIKPALLCKCFCIVTLMWSLFLEINKKGVKKEMEVVVNREGIRGRGRGKEGRMGGEVER